MSTKYKFHNQEQLYFITFAIVNRIDLFIRNEYRQILLDSWHVLLNSTKMRILYQREACLSFGSLVIGSLVLHEAEYNHYHFGK